MRIKRFETLIVVALLSTFVLSQAVDAQDRTARQASGTRESQGDYAAYKLLQRAQELIDAGEKDRGVKMFETVVEQFPKSPIRFQAYLALGKHYLDVGDYAVAIEHLRNLEQLEKGKKALEGDDRERYLEGLYLTGVANFHLRQYGSTFSSLRKITNNYPDTVWANKAFYHIGMSHFAQSHWDKAIKALSKVGTFIDPDSPTLAYAEASHRFHIRITDGDLPVLQRLGREIVVKATTASGDEETIVCKPAGTDDEIYIGSILTDPGEPAKDDGTLQIIGGDRITVRYLDDNTKAGEKDVVREKVVDVVSSAGLTFTLGTFESLTPAAYLGQPLFLRMWDLDKDTTAERNTVTVRVASMYKPAEEELAALEAEEPADVIDVEELLRGDDSSLTEDEEQLAVRDEVILTLNERGEDPVRTGIFIGSLPIQRALNNDSIDKSDARLSAMIGDKIVATYIDDVHIGGRVPIEVTAELTVAGEIDSSPRAAQDVVPDSLVRAKKQLVEAEAFLELARIFKDMGLTRGAQTKAHDGLLRTDDVVRSRADLPSSLKENAFRLKWDLHLAEGDFGKAMSTCNTFNKLYPESPLVDRALMGIAAALAEKEDYKGAINVWRQVTRLSNSHAKAEAQFNIAETLNLSEDRNAAINEYMACAQRYPNSEFAGKALGEVVVYHTKSGAYDVADDLLEQIFVDYQDEDFLDEMLYRWIVVSFASGDHAKAKSKYEQLISEYPGSRAAMLVEKNGTLERIENAMKSATKPEDDS
jgi:TolA-binding protein